MHVTNYTITSPSLPASFDGFIIAHVSDLHNREFKTELIAQIEKAKPDIIAVTGDSIHIENQTEAAERFFTYASGIAKTYVVYGNHEKVLKCLPEFEDRIGGYVKILKNEYEVIVRDDEKIAILGMNDPAFFGGGKQEFTSKLTELQSEIRETGINYTILLSHRPEMFERYCEAGINLSLVGHAHGGHVRLPLIGAFYAPNQGLFPKYTEDIHNKGECSMVISKGLGKSSWVPRILNPPELCIITLRRQQL